MIVTLAMLRDHGACETQVARFERIFGKKKAVSVAACLKVAEKFDFQWAGCNLLHGKRQGKFCQAIRLADDLEQDRLAVVFQIPADSTKRIAALRRFDRARQRFDAEAFARAAGDKPMKPLEARAKKMLS